MDAVYGTRERYDRLAERPGSARWLAEAGVAALEASTSSAGCATDECVSDKDQEGVDSLMAAARATGPLLD